MKTLHIFFLLLYLHCQNAILEILRTAPTETSRSPRNVQDTCLPIVTCFTNIPRTYKNMGVHSVHNASCLYFHIWAKKRGKEVNYACRCRVAQSTAKDLFAAFQTENATHEFDVAKNHCRRVLQTESWTCQQWSLQWTHQIIKPHVIHLHIRSRLKNGDMPGSARRVFFVHCSCISMKTLHIFFRAVLT